MSRFGRKSKKQKGLFSSVCILLLVLAMSFLLLGQLQRDTTLQQKEQLEEALRRSIVRCYALEGSYPRSLSDLLENYPVLYNKDQFLIDYRVEGSNLMPDVTVLERGQ